MDKRMLFVLVIMGCFLCCKARDLALAQFSERSDIAVEVLGANELPKEESETKVETANDEQLCLVCEEFASEALRFLSENKTQTDILAVFHKYCSMVPSFKKKCVLLVNYYGELFFSTLDSVQPGEFCRKFGLCEGSISASSRISKNKCDVCHDFVTEALLKLKDPDTELEIVKVLLKACDSIGKSVAKLRGDRLLLHSTLRKRRSSHRTGKCKKLVFEYTPLLLVNAEQFLETKDICTILHACDAPASREVPASLLTAS